MAEMTVDISGLSVEELGQLRDEIDVRVARVREETARKAFEQMEHVAAGVGMSLQELVEKFGPKPRAKGGGKKRAAVKFRNPENPEETWTGKGRKPNWIDRELQAGRGIEEFSV